MLDLFSREINYLRVSVTDRCNFRCRYCMPEEGVSLLSHNDILRFNEIVAVVQEAAVLGVKKIKITGGEPLVRKNIVALIAELARIEGITDFGMTTNGSLLAAYAHELKQAGLHRINISLDTVDPVKFAELTRGGSLEEVLKGIQAAQAAGFEKIKINTVINQSPDETEAQAVARFAALNKLEIRYIRQMDLEKGEFWQVHGGSGGNCAQCNRLRLTSNGNIHSCLFSDIAFNIRELGIREALLAAVQHKPEKGVLSIKKKFYSVGG